MILNQNLFIRATFEEGVSCYEFLKIEVVMEIYGLLGLFNNLEVWM